jgi:hypothetical protein
MHKPNGNTNQKETSTLRKTLSYQRKSSKRMKRNTNINGNPYKGSKNTLTYQEGTKLY